MPFSDRFPPFTRSITNSNSLYHFIFRLVLLLTYLSTFPGHDLPSFRKSVPDPLSLEHSSILMTLFWNRASRSCMSLALDQSRSQSQSVPISQITITIAKAFMCVQKARMRGCARGSTLFSCSALPLSCLPAGVTMRCNRERDKMTRCQWLAGLLSPGTTTTQPLRIRGIGRFNCAHHPILFSAGLGWDLA